jgi:hypothetical protein
MTKREAIRHAHGQAYAVIQSHIDSGSEFECDDEDLPKVIAALDKLAQRHFERWKPLPRVARKPIAGRKQRISP